MHNKHIGSNEIRRIVKADIAYTAYNSVRVFQEEDAQFEQRQFGNAVAVRDRARESAYYNRCIGFGATEIAHVDAIIAFYDAIGRSSTVTLTPDSATEPVLKALADYGFTLASAKPIFIAPAATNAFQNPDIEIRRAVPQDIAAIVALWTAKSDTPLSENAIQRRAPAQWVPEFSIYLAYLDGQVAAMATTFFSEGSAWLGNANTFHAFRGRGCQLALIHHRIHEASKMGCDLIFSDTDFGTASHRNMDRAGMQLAYFEFEVSRPVTP
jgi:hypothetical protein